MEEYHPAYRKPPLHDHHRRARRTLITGTALILFGIVSIYWADEAPWGERQLDLARWTGAGSIAVGLVVFVVGSILWFAVDDDQHPELPE